jgi:hypothetical protein
MSTARADKQLTALQNVLGLSDAGKAWLTAAIDPFHDEEIAHLEGLPDGLETRSCVQIMRSSATLKCPAQVTSGTWDCSIVSFPYVDSLPTVLGTAAMGVASNQTAQPTYSGLISLQDLSINVGPYFGGVSAISGPTGDDLDWTNLRKPNNVYTNINPPVYMSGNYRIIAKGFEVISSGPDLYKSGAVYVWNQPRPIDNENITEYKYFDGTAYWNSSFQIPLVFDSLPKNVGLANSIPNTQSWPAKEGVYIVDRFDGPNRPTHQYGADPIVYVDGPPYSNSAVDNPPTAYANFAGAICSAVTPLKFNGGTVTWNWLEFSKVADTSFNHSGAYFVGLSLQDVLTVNTVWYVERIPTVSQPDLMYLAKPTPCVDRVALDIYNYLASVMPVGMVQRSNGFGDWFKDAVGVVTDIVAPVASVLPGPVGAIGKGLTAVGGIAKKFLSDDKPTTIPATYSEQRRPVIIENDESTMSVRPKAKKKKSKLRKEDGKALMDLNSLKQELKSMRSKMKKKKKK